MLSSLSRSKLIYSYSLIKVCTKVCMCMCMEKEEESTNNFIFAWSFSPSRYKDAYRFFYSSDNGSQINVSMKKEKYSWRETFLLFIRLLKKYSLLRSLISSVLPLFFANSTEIFFLREFQWCSIFKIHLVFYLLSSELRKDDLKFKAS